MKNTLSLVSRLFPPKIRLPWASVFWRKAPYPRSAYEKYAVARQPTLSA
jgi:hypothetical protein